MKAMKFFRIAFPFIAFSALSFTQSQGYDLRPQTNAPAPANSGNLNMLLEQIEQQTQGLNMDVGKLRTDRWKTDATGKQQASENAASIQRNVTAALPGLIAAVRTAPQSLAANFKLYRNLNALYEAVASLGESAGAFGKREEYETIAPHVSALDDLRRNYADALQQMTATVDDRLTAAARQAQSAANQPPKKIIVDDTDAAPATKKRKSKKTTASSSSGATSAPK